jgi:hypothetical protein
MVLPAALCLLPLLHKSHINDQPNYSAQDKLFESASAVLCGVCCADVIYYY